MRDIPLLAINHTYQEIGLFPKAVVSGGTGIYYSADNIWILGRQQEKEGTEIKGYNFIINVEKSRFVKEKSRIPISVTWEGGIKRSSGLLEMGLETGFIIKPSNGWYSKVDIDTGVVEPKKYRAKELDDVFWESILADPKFRTLLKDKYEIGHKDMIV